MSQQKRNRGKEFFKKYRLVISDRTTLAEKFSLYVSRFRLYLFASIFAFFVAAFVVSIIFYTPLKQLVPGYPSNHLRDVMFYNQQMLDSLSREIEKRDTYLYQIQQVIAGRIIKEEVQPIKPEKNHPPDISILNSDSLFVDLIGPDKYKFNSFDDGKEVFEISRLNFFTPVKGIVVNRFESTPGHYGTDIVAEKDAYISAVLDGTVVFAEWSVTTGFVVQIQHSNNLVSIYKHNADLLVKSGQKVKAGEIIAIMGDEGEYSTGPHLHFELWQNGVPLNAENFIAFDS